jgi:hypothetical protein
MKGQRQRALSLLCCLALGLSGCAYVVAGAVGAGIGFGTYKYVDGNLERDYLGPMPKIWVATVAALDKLKVTPEVQESDYFGGLVKGIMHDGTKVTVQLKRESESSTEVGVRVGIFGDKEKSETIHAKIAQEFKSG